MEIIINIGREVSGQADQLVPSTCTKVSRDHAVVRWEDGAVYIEDKKTPNGTFVNGRRIAKKKLKEEDEVWLGGIGSEDCYKLDMKELFGSCRKKENSVRTDWSKEFEDIKQAYIDYQTELAHLRKTITIRTQLPVRILSFLPTLIGAIIALKPDADMAKRITVISVGGAITGLINILMTGKNSNINEKMSEEITELQIRYQPRYCCPKCGYRFSLNTHWKKLEADGKCPNPKCDAEFVKKS